MHLRSVYCITLPFVLFLCLMVGKFRLTGSMSAAAMYDNLTVSVHLNLVIPEPTHSGQLHTAVWLNTGN